ncbi:ABC-type branched-subunit amino acid transport system substrate-binding protein [Maribacter spongiicola]|uniref:ABC-type branched-subunit amino acid transport system substrate-binding protein n=1 Tax=Maribacter spongiicola TaxID=1206753 RepID=A0A4R7JJ61_9FLAO|nr:LysM peptidoglycan-binding domain-containing protein [Maribacter spongiicola]TDT37960.1 ABC-type branched-subunit amino acid transport system substrate-binding protein [Maribacter spongiicola]
MKYIFNQVYIIGAFCLLVSCTAMAQKFNTHEVKSGETLQSIAKMYGVTPASILQYNKEIKEGQKLRSNTILVVPGKKIVAETSTPTSNTATIKGVKNEVQESITEREPVGYTEHRVKKKETIFGITQMYKITEDELKKYNPALYASPLQKKMVLRIPKYRAAMVKEVSTDEGDLEKYIVAAKETRWSIAHKYGITIEKMLELNPSLSAANNYLSEGYELMMPRIAGSTVKNQVTQLYTSYTVPAKMNFYRLEKEFGVKSDEIVRLNPEITERGGLKEGMVIRIPEQKVATGEINTDNYIFYEVKPKQNEFRLTRKFGMTWAELVQLNPDLKGGLKAGMVLKLPKDKVGDFEVRNALVLDKVNLLDSINVGVKPKVLFLLPFRLDKVNLEDKESAEKTIDARRDMTVSLGLYSGALVAIDSMKSLGVSIDVKTLDNQLDLATTKQLLQGEQLGNYNAVFGPLDAPSLKETAVQASKFNVPVIAPVNAKSDISLENVFFSYTDEEILWKHMLDYVEKKHNEETLLIIADEDNKKEKDAILKRFPTAKVVVVKEEDKNIGINRDKLQTLLSDEVSNWVFVESDNYKLIASVVSILNSFNNTALDPELAKDKVKVRMFTTDMNSAFENDVISNTHLSNLKFTYPSVNRQVTNNSFVERYRTRFGDDPDRYAVRGFDLTYDLLLKLAYSNNLIEVSRFIGETEYNGNKFDYQRKGVSGYHNQSSYIMMIDDLRIKTIE